MRGFFFATNRRTSGYYGNEKALFLNVRNPLTEMRGGGRDAHSIEDSVKDGTIACAGEGVLNNPYLNGDLAEDRIIEIVVPHPSQIKSATDNIGRFFRTDDDILMREGTPASMVGWHTASAGMERRHMEGHVKALAGKLRLNNVGVVMDASAPESRRRGAKGCYDPATDRITVIVPNRSSVEDVESTLLHEAVAHHGSKKMFGRRFDEFLDEVADYADGKVRGMIADLTKAKSIGIRIATEEYLASLAKDTDSEKARGLEWWTKVKEMFVRMLRLLGFRNTAITDDELRQIAAQL